MKNRKFVFFKVIILVLAVVLMAGCGNKDNRQNKDALVEVSAWERDTASG